MLIAATTHRCYDRRIFQTQRRAWATSYGIATWPRLFCCFFFGLRFPVAALAASFSAAAALVAAALSTWNSAPPLDSLCLRIRHRDPVSVNNTLDKRWAKQRLVEKRPRLELRATLLALGCAAPLSGGCILPTKQKRNAKNTNRRCPIDESGDTQMCSHKASSNRKALRKDTIMGLSLHD